MDKLGLQWFGPRISLDPEEVIPNWREPFTAHGISHLFEYVMHMAISKGVQ